VSTGDRHHEDDGEEDVAVVPVQQAEDLRPDHPAGDPAHDEQRRPEDHGREHPAHHGDADGDDRRDGERSAESLRQQPAECEAGRQHRKVDRAEPDEAEQQPDNGQSDAGHLAPPAGRPTRIRAAADRGTGRGRFSLVTRAHPPAGGLSGGDSPDHRAFVPPQKDESVQPTARVLVAVRL
jgi:hypothetical protein